ncbi:MAG: alpha/beta hydrolase [Vulcanimicrobiaceae bacterium]
MTSQDCTDESCSRCLTKTLTSTIHSSGVDFPSAYVRSKRSTTCGTACSLVISGIRGQDIAPGTQDVFTVPLRDTPRRQLAVRDAAARPGTYPLIVFSHHSGGHRRTATFLCTHLSSHGYVSRHWIILRS